MLYDYEMWWVHVIIRLWTIVYSFITKEMFFCQKYLILFSDKNLPVQ